MVQNIMSDDPTLFLEVVKHDKWRKALDNKTSSLEKDQTLELVDLPIGVKWIFKTKLNDFGEVNKYIAQFVANGYSPKLELIPLKCLSLLYACI